MSGKHLPQSDAAADSVISKKMTLQGAAATFGVHRSTIWRAIKRKIENEKKEKNNTKNI